MNTLVKEPLQFRRDILSVMVNHSADCADVMAAAKEIVLSGLDDLHNQPGEAALLISTARKLDEAIALYHHSEVEPPNPPSTEELLRMAGVGREGN